MKEIVDDEWFPHPMKSKEKNPKIQLSFDGCYNYERLKKSGLVDTLKFAGNYQGPLYAPHPDLVNKEPDNIHEVMYQKSIEKGSTLSMGGSEEYQS